MRTIDVFFNKPITMPLYHYTGIGSLMGITQSKTLWASNAYYLNDGEEILYALKLLQKVIRDRERAESNSKVFEFLLEFGEWLNAFSSTGFNIFIFSFSQEQNILSQWRSYTPHGKGVSLGFSPEIINQIVSENELKIARCRYSPEEHNEIMNALLGKMLETFNQHSQDLDTTNKPSWEKYHDFLEQFRGDILQVFSVIKHPSFSEEKEWRLISPYFDKYTVEEIKYREGASMLVPYIELKFGRWHNLKQHTHPVFFESVCLGPSQHKRLSYNALQQFLSNQKVSHLTINSNVPYREWI